jgi:hypothetical protein
MQLTVTERYSLASTQILNTILFLFLDWETKARGLTQTFQVHPQSTDSHLIWLQSAQPLSNSFSTRPLWIGLSKDGMC